MGTCTAFTAAHDIRWQGTQRFHHTIFLIKNIVLFLFIILIIVEYALLKSWVNHERYGRSWDWEGYPYNFWVRIGMALIPDVGATIVYLVLMLRRSTYSFHPVFALVASIVMFGLYVSVCCLNALLAASNEASFRNSDTWGRLAYGETGVQVVLCLLWVAMMAFSCVAVHKWRMAKKAGGKGVGLEGIDLEGRY